jgi:hypothetical protein
MRSSPSVRMNAANDETGNLLRCFDGSWCMPGNARVDDRKEFPMPEPEPARPETRRGLRYSVRALMGMIGALALILAVLSPLYHLGLPPCLTPVKTASWLVAKPAAASCMDCHAGK